VPVCPTPPELWSEEVLEEVARLLRRLHDATVGVEVPDGGWREGAAAPEGGEVICHNDLARYNTVFQAGRPVAFAGGRHPGSGVTWSSSDRCGSPSRRRWRLPGN
jgi:hypothetical protein